MNPRHTMENRQNKDITKELVPIEVSQAIVEKKDDDLERALDNDNEDIDDKENQVENIEDSKPSSEKKDIDAKNQEKKDQKPFSEKKDIDTKQQEEKDQKLA